MGYINIVQKLDQDIATKLQQLQAQQQELLQKQQNLHKMQEDIQSFLNSAQELKILLDSEPDLLKSLRLELGKIFSMQAPTLPIHKPEKNQQLEQSKPSVDENNVEPTNSSISSLKKLVIEEEEELVNSSSFVDAQGQDRTFN